MRTLLASLAVIFSLQASTRSEYSPGTPGGAWSQAELLTVRAKLWRMYSNNQAVFNWWRKDKIPNDLPNPSFKADLGFFAAKVVRLSFHDCLRYADGGGGCDGCLNWEGVGTRFSVDDLKYQFLEDDVTETNNNGLEYTVAVLEELYTNPSFPPGATKLSESLRSSGKSRADLWSYAAKVAVEFAVEQNNYQCEDKPSDWAGSYVGKATDCMRNKGEADCEARLPREIKFKFGRADCETEDPVQYRTSRHETHPNPEGNGDHTLDFFQSQFGFSGRETVAILGAHTLGRMNPSHSLLKYVWTVRGGHMFNNAYYKNFVRQTDWFIQSWDDETCTLLGDATGTLPDVKWVPTMNGFTKSGGPMHWIRMNFACPYCEKRNEDSVFMAREFDRCCPGRQDLACLSDNATRNFEDDITGCEKYRFAFGKDEMAMNAEMGLYLQFDVENGIPQNCPGFEQFNMDHWKKKPNQDTLRRAYNQGCPLNMRSLPEDDIPVSSIIAEYANDQDLWLGEFIQVFEKMMQNGYEETDLTEAPGSWEDVRCLNKQGIVCS